jgi:hypothetical protein
LKFRKIKIEQTLGKQDKTINKVEINKLGNDEIEAN